eukprot:CAMPEP_0173409970 /NCGR_PEP_ID=MMETSP1356-20130122/73473_1 /TAXON_ID=77927 ORGANISM="Hemiselmis virescens, Strain PCC157" /NCGR_SAMPLE_ID=MMETSP1356 /ASSEMBLY_ACC=CAM_ASM_000847 /LENGTH=32 /DNA_ID= /DNA_START= /DNA_END= /DNA_ORIENTATION=
MLTRLQPLQPAEWHALTAAVYLPGVAEVSPRP